MITWGISANSHNASLAVFNDNKIIFASESERFSGIKNDAHLNQPLIDYAMQYGKPNHIVWYEKPFIKSLRQLYAGQGLVNNNVENYLKSWNLKCPVSKVSHHESHAAAGYFTSKFTEACVVVIDAIGEFECLSIWKAQGTKLTRLYSVNYPNSIGLWYSAMTQRCGLKPNEEEYILMGMAAYGDPNILMNDICNDFIKSFEKQTFKRNLHRGCLDWRPDLSEESNFNIAAATQKVYEKLFENVLLNAKRLVNSSNLVIMGGCALNCVSNSLAYKYFNNVWIMPAPGDSGSSIGAVLAHNKEFTDWPGIYLGYDLGYNTPNKKIVDYLIKNKICGLARGRAEFGPRALGNRSLIADPRGPEIKNEVNKIKKRQEFRPFAPAILEEFANEYFEMPTDKAPYMQYAVNCKKPELFPAIIHHDNTSRVQTVGKNDNPEFRSLLELWYKKTGCPMLLNTSLNIKGQPMVNNEVDCLNWTKNYDIKIFT